MNQYVPTTAVVRDSYAKAWYEQTSRQSHAEFDHWLAAHEEKIRAAERERIAQAIETAHHSATHCDCTYGHAARIARESR